MDGAGPIPPASPALSTTQPARLGAPVARRPERVGDQSYPFIAIQEGEVRARAVVLATGECHQTQASELAGPDFALLARS